MSGTANRPISAPTGKIEVVAETEQLIEDLVYEHLIDLVDFDRMYELEQVIYFKLAEPYHAKRDDKDGDGDDDDDYALEPVDDLVTRSAAIIKRAWLRLIDDERRYITTRFKPDDDCPLCKMLAGEVVHGKDDDAPHSHGGAGHGGGDAGAGAGAGGDDGCEGDDDDPAIEEASS